MNEIQRADPSARRAALVILGCGTLAGVVLITVASRLRPALMAWLEQDLPARLPFVAAAAIVLTTSPLLGLAAYVWRLGARVIRGARYPPPGLRLTRDTRVMTGPAARHRGRLMQVLAAVLAVAAVLLAVLFWRLVSLLSAAAA